MPNAPFLAPERDSAFKKGRGKKSGTTYYSIPGVVGLANTTLVLAASGTDFYTPWYADTPIIIDQLVINVTTGVAGNARIGFYAADTDWQPVGAPLADSGNIDVTSTGLKTYTPGAAVFVPRGRYLSVINSDVTPTMQYLRGGTFQALSTDITQFASRWRVTRAYAAFPTPGTAWDTITGDGNVPLVHYVAYRVLTP